MRFIAALLLALMLVGCGGSATVYYTPYTDVYVENYTGYTWDFIGLYGYGATVETYLTLYPDYTASLGYVESGWYDIVLWDSYFNTSMYFYDVYIDGDYFYFEVW